MRVSEAKVRAEGDKVLLVIDGRAALMAPEAARQLGKALCVKAGEAELANPRIADGLVRDQGLIFRLGLKLGLIGDRKLAREARKFAEEDRDLRRYLPGGVPSGETFGTPSVEVGAPKHA